ncbi:MAG: flagellar protein FlgN [candidate division Zixibacteria bacterium]|nr:flagellar protein FlgN [candidate division Zixibacteria bacterium]
MVNKLIEIISKEAALFESFLELLERQKEMLVANDLKGLNEVVECQREKLIESKLLNKQREELVAAIKASRAIDGDLTVTRLLKLVDENQASRLTQLRDIINSLNEKITDARNANAMLLNHSREFIARTMEMLSKINNPDNIYARDGRNEKQGSNIMVDRRI